jgi:PiT family inorganic phosphate transporter
VQSESFIPKVVLSFAFLGVVWGTALFFAPVAETAILIAAAAAVGGYMAINIGANDVANNMGAAVGARALSMVGALVIAGICEAAGAIFAGGDVVQTIAKGIIDAGAMPNAETFVTVMLAALLAAALWLNLATWMGLPVSTTHSIVGGVLGAGIAAAGMNAVAWPTMAGIAASWLISPALGGIIAALFLALIRFTVLSSKDMIGASKKWVPIVVGIMAGCFAIYFTMKGLKKVWKPDTTVIIAIGIAFFAATVIAMRLWIERRAPYLTNDRNGVYSLFVVPLVFSAALLSFAHGANDVANAIGPLAAIVGVIGSKQIATSVDIPVWVMTIGALGISFGLVLFGPKIIRAVGEQITRLNPVRAFCVALSAAITVIIASALGLPVSSTHIAVGGIFGVGFLREYVANRRRVQMVLKLDSDEDGDAEEIIAAFQKRRLVRRRPLLTIVAAWLVTVPMAAALAALLYFALNAYGIGQT